MKTPPRKRRPIRGAPRGRIEEPTEKKMKQLVAAIERGDGEQEKNYWNRIGVAFEDRDGSYNLRSDYIPARMEQTTIQLRNFDPREE